MNGDERHGSAVATRIGSKRQAAAGARLRGWSRAIIAIVCAALLAAACGPDTAEFPMPDQFPQPIDDDATIEAVPCAAMSDRALTLDPPLEPDTAEWARQFRNALEASAARTLFANPAIASVGNDADVATGNPWGLADDIFATYSDDGYWAQLCDQDTVEVEDVAGFVDFMNNRITLDFRLDVTTMIEPAYAPYERL